MTSTQYQNLKLKFKELTGKDADENLTAFLSYINFLALQDIKDYLRDFRDRLIHIENNTKKF